MTSVLSGGARSAGDAEPALPVVDTPVRVFVVGYAATLSVPVLALVVLLTAWTLSAGAGWAAAGTAVVLWSAATAAWLRRRAWTPPLVHLVTWIVPAALGAPSAAFGWLAADGLVVWVPMTTLLCVCLAADRWSLTPPRE